jgi:acyl-CoA reductase-like NAD-dependent aldehyde dehydrogenase
MNALKQRKGLYIAGEWVGASQVEPVVNPASEAVLGEAPVATNAQVELALAASREAFDRGPWPRLPQTQRQAKVAQFLHAIERRAGEIIPLIIEESGSLQALANIVQFALPLQLARYLVEISTRPAVTPLPVDVVPNAQGTLSLAASVVSREPVGVVVAITPYNVPFLTNVCKSVAAMLVGCTVILKPSPYTPFEALVLGEIADEVSLPKGVLNIVTGGPEVGTVLTSDKRVDMITFTGSDKVGAAIQAQAAPTLKRVVLELGGKSALIVRHDADIGIAAAAGLGGITMHCGQGCVLLTRHIVHNSIRSKYVDALKNLIGGVKVGDPNDPAATMGPLIREEARARTEKYVDIARAEGGRLIAGGKRPAHLKRGFYYEPTLFDGVSNTSRIAQEEVFGPLGVVIGFDTDEEAIAIANDSEYGLSGAVFSTNVGRAYELALQFRSGGVTVNTGFPQLTRNAPFGGIKRSGHGREYGELGLSEFTYIKTIDFQAT